MSNDSTRYLLICDKAKNTKIDISIFKITCLLGLHGAVKVETVTIPPMKKIEKLYQTKLELGGRFKPKQCIARHRVAIIVPYRDREEHLRTFLLHMHSYLPRQQLDYGIFVVEQHGSEPFNRAMLMNVGAAEALKNYEYQCFIFHDVDLLPEDDRNLYSCPVQPRHMSVAINKYEIFNNYLLFK